MSSAENDHISQVPNQGFSELNPWSNPTEGYFKAILASGPDLADVAIAKILLNSPDSEVRDRAAAYFPQFWKAYLADRGSTLHTHAFGQRAAWGLVLFWNGLVDWDYRIELIGTVTPSWERVLQDCTTAISEAQRVLRGTQKIFTLEKLSNLMLSLFIELDTIAISPGSQLARDRLEEVVTFVDERRKVIEEGIRKIGIQKDRRTAQQMYLFGMLPGLAVVAAVLTPVAVFTKLDLDAVGTLAAGSLGAILSVLARTTRAQAADSLDVDYQVGNVLIFFAALFRPIVGALLAGALYVLINAGLIPLKIPTQTEGKFFFIAIGFLAGFSERLAQDALVRTSRATFL